MLRVLGEPDHGGAFTRARGELGDRLLRRGHERRFQQQVLGRVSRNHQLGEHHQVAALGDGSVVALQRPLDVAVEVTDHRVDLSGSDAQPRHGPKDMHALRKTRGRVARHSGR